MKTYPTVRTGALNKLWRGWPVDILTGNEGWPGETRVYIGLPRGKKRWAHITEIKDKEAK